MPTLNLSGFTFSQLFEPVYLKKLDDLFLQTLLNIDVNLTTTLQAYRDQQCALSSKEISEFLINVAIHLDEFLITLFDIEKAANLAQAQTLSHNPVSAFKQFFVLRRAKKQLQHSEKILNFHDLNAWLHQQLHSAPLKTDDLELAISLLGVHYITDPDKYSLEIENLTHWCIHGLITPEAKSLVSHWVSFHLPERINYDNLVPCAPLPEDTLNRLTFNTTQLTKRDGFKLTDPRMNAREVQDQVNYCIFCHDHDGDFCSKGFPAKKGDPTQGLKKNPLDVILTGCPLEEKISEMHVLKRDGFTLAALAMIMVDNPMCPATGHRICNDCMKACIYQKQDPVNIPQIETRVLTDVLNLPWGVEIYDLLTRWNPLRQKQWVAKPYNGLKVMIAGMGPAGFTLSHHLLMEGFAVVGFDGLKIEPLPEKYCNEPIYQFDEIKEALDARIMAGFGGVAEYGITVRWDKNFLKLIYINLLRRNHFQVFGNTRFGGTIRISDAWEMGFDHFVVAVGAGLPKALSIPGSLAPGMRQANDFLMALQLGNAAKKESLTNLQIRLPAVVIGGGLTGVDTATEVQAYYISQVEKIARRYEKLITHLSEETFYKDLTPADVEILNEYISHGKLVRLERERAARVNETPNFIPLLRAWGGVSIVYRRTMQDSPAYINNHEELIGALKEGVFYLEALEPADVQLNHFGHTETLICHRRLKNTNNEWETSAEEIKIPARAIFVATGTQPNIAYEFEHRGTFTRQGVQYQHYENVDGEFIIPHGIMHCKEPGFGPFTSYEYKDHRVSLIGDTHPVFHGNVVKAIASGMRTYPKIVSLLQNKLNQKTGDSAEYGIFSEKMNRWFNTFIHSVKRHSDTVIELIIQAPLAAKHFQPGQFYRLQNYETHAHLIEATLLQIEPLALIAAHADKNQGLLTFIIIENGASTKLCATFKAGDPIALMGPTGTRAKISNAHETVLIIGGQLSLPLVQCYGKSLKQAGNRVLFLGNFNHAKEVYCQSILKEATDSIIWNTQNGELIKPTRPEDMTFSGDIIATLLHYAKNHPSISLMDVDRIYIIGNPFLLKQFQEARKTVLKEYLVKEPCVLGSVYSTMQCMLKGVCAQCLQWQIDPETGKRTKAVFACSWPDQPLEIIDLDNIEERQQQNHLQEYINSHWVDYLFSRNEINRI